MTTTWNDAETEDRESLDALVGGAVRRDLGLEREDLDVALRLARMALDRSADGEALKLYSAIMICDPSYVEGHVGAAICALRLEHYDMALEIASAIVALAPRDPRGYVLSGQACMGLDLPAEAREDLEDARRLAVAARNADVAEEARRLLATLAPGDVPG